jgi:hypothetical protein
MKTCSRPGCFAWIDSDAELCTYDEKVRDGLITPDVQGYGRRWTTAKPRRSPQTVAASDVVTDEQLEVARLMRAMGADEHVVTRALAKDRTASGGRKGTGVKLGRLAPLTSGRAPQT